MRYYVNDLKGDKFEYRVQQKNLHDRNFREVEPNIFKSILLINGINYELPEDKIERLEKENADLLLDVVTKDIRIEQTEEDLANILLTIGGM